MPTGSLSERLIGPLRRLAAAGDPRPRSDGELLAAFVRTRDAVAFESLVRRHGPMVYGVCRRVVRHTATAEDAFQAVFVVLARRAATVRPGEQVANFLFGVAFRTALKAKGRLARLRSREKQVDAMPEPAARPADWDDLQPVLDAELAALPDKLRLPVVLCDLEGRPQREVARQLNLPTTTLVNRLTAGRRKLAERLAARGVTLSGGAVAAVVSANAAQAVPPTLLASAAKLGLAAVGSGPGVVPANVLELSEGVVRMFAVSKLKAVTAVVVGAVLLGGTGVGLVKADDPPAKPAAQKLRPDLSDAEFLKRVCDSLRGSPATPAEIGYFVADKDAAKRGKVVKWLTEEPTLTARVDILLSDKSSQLGFQPVADTETARRRLSLDLTGTPNAVRPTAAPDWARALGIHRLGMPDGSVVVYDADTDGKLDLLLTNEKVNPPAADIVLSDDVTFTLNAIDATTEDTDAAFLNRVIEAARGGKPTRLETEYFTADKDAKKREKLLDLILSDPATAKKLGPDWKKAMQASPQMLYGVFVMDSGNQWANKLIGELLAAKKTDDQMLEALTLAATGRLPTDTEKKLAAALVTKQKDRSAAWQEVASTLAGTDEAKKHADRLKPNANVQFRTRVAPLHLDVQTKPAEPKK
jgi:RNA polymerase sigma factor (sigma-70 family)